MCPCGANTVWQGQTGNPSSFAGCFAHATFNIEVHREQTGDGIGYSGPANVPAGTSRFLSRNADGTAMALQIKIVPGVQPQPATTVNMFRAAKLVFLPTVIAEVKAKKFRKIYKCGGQSRHRSTCVTTFNCSDICVWRQIFYTRLVNQPARRGGRMAQTFLSWRKEFSLTWF